MGVLFQFDIGRAGDQGFDVEGGQGDEVGLGLIRGVGRGESEEGVADLFDVDGAGEGRLLGVVALELMVSHQDTGM